MRWGVNFLGRKSFRECPISQNMRRFRPEGLAARRAHCGGVSMEWLSQMRSTPRQALWTETP